MLKKKVPDDIATVRIMTGVGEKVIEQKKLVAHETVKLDRLNSRMEVLTKENVHT